MGIMTMVGKEQACTRWEIRGKCGKIRGQVASFKT